MLLAKFGMVFLLAWMTMLVAMVRDRNAPMGGPYYYAESPGHPNPVQPRRRITAIRAYRARRHIQVLYNDLSLPVIIKHMEGRQEAWRLQLIWDRLGRLRVRTKMAGGVVLSTERFDYPAPQAG